MVVGISITPELPMYEDEIKAIISAIASGTTSVTYRDRSVTYTSFEDLVARLNFLRGNEAVTWRTRAVNPETSKGLHGKGDQ